MSQNPKDIEENARLVTRRGMFVGGVQLAFMGVLGMRMRQMQIEEAADYRLLAEENRINIRLLAPPRGIIFDRNGVIIADNRQNLRITIVREQAGDVDEVVAKLRTLITFDELELERALKEVRRKSPFVEVTLADKLTWDDFSRVAVNSPSLPGITPDVGLSRYYPMKGDFAHVIGYVGPVSDYDLSQIEDPDPLLQIPKFQIGKVGVETKLEEDLRGAAGNKRIEVNAAGRVMRELDRDPGIAGKDVQLTVDAGLQNFCQARLEGESAAVVVIDCDTGDILALGSAPAFDPNLFVRGISSADYKVLTDDKYVPLRNKTVQGTYPPGSTYKMVTALAALEAGVVDPRETVWCPGHYQLGRRRFHCWKRGGHGHTNLEKSLVESCDVYYYDVSQRVGIDQMSAMANKLGLGVRHDIPMSAVAEGLAPTQRWKQLRKGDAWRVGDTLNSSIGQGFTLSSPLQLATMTARLASGRALVPRLIKSLGGDEQGGDNAPPLEIATSHLNMIRKAMYNVCNGRGGTAGRSRIVADGHKLAGKTGTSQVRNITAAERARGVFRNEDLPWERRDHALFVGYAPHDKPKYACAVVVEHGGGGSKAAAPVARDVLLFAQYGGKPPMEAYPADQRERMKTMWEEMILANPEPPAPARSRA
ncbi:MAG: penicillin-binding protein 2 [Pseudomonadota bacterium]